MYYFGPTHKGFEYIMGLVDIEEAKDLEVTTNQDTKIDPVEPDEDAIGDAEDAVETILLSFGWDMDNPSLEGTPHRFIKYLKEFHNPLDLQEVLGKAFDSDDAAMVIQCNIPFRMVCEHHLLPALGYAWLGYIPSGKVVGLSKLTRLVQAVGVMKPSLQEHIAHKIANALEEFLKPKGVMLVIRSEHTCMACRGVNVAGVPTVTSSTKGVFLTDPAARAEFLALMKG